MATFNKQELQAIARLSSLKFTDQELEVFAEQIQTILGYVDQLQGAKLTTEATPVRTVNRLREDEAIPTDPSPVLALAPELDERFYVVPKILDEK
jgi:aspartyl-tRNA(Asn)/glutamyl-tRNA(Gln) amidotransferase subunit C